MTLTFTKPPEKPKLNVLIYGPPGAGKSAGAGTAPGGVLYLNFDLPNATRFVHKRNPDGRIMEVKVPTFEEGKKQIMDLLTEVTHMVNSDQDVIESVVVDPVGEMYRQMLEEQSNRAARPSLPQYGDVSTYIERFCRMLCKAPVNAIFVCHELTQKNEATGDVEKHPFTGTAAGSAVLGQKLSGMVDIVCYAGVNPTDNGKQYLGRLYPAKGANGKDRFDCLGDMREIQIAEWVDEILADEKKAVSTLTQDEGPAKTTGPADKPSSRRKAA